MGKKLVLLFVTVFAFSTGVVLGNSFIDYVFAVPNAVIADSSIEEKDTTVANNSIIESENSSTKDEESPSQEIENTNDNQNEVSISMLK